MDNADRYRMVGGAHIAGGKGKQVVDKDVEDGSTYLRHLRSIPFIHMVSIIAPGPVASTVQTKANLALVECHVESLVSQEFIENNIRRDGCDLVGFSMGTRPDRGNSIAVIEGHLLLCVDKDTFEQLGIIGKCRSGGGSKGVTVPLYDIDIDLQSPSFVPGKALHDRVLFAFSASRMSIPDVKMMFRWNSGDLSIPGATVKGFENVVESKRYHNCTIPSMDLDMCDTCKDKDESESERVVVKDKDRLFELFEWLGMAGGGLFENGDEGEEGGGLGEYVSKYVPPAPYLLPDIAKSLSIYSIRGFISIDDVESSIQSAFKSHSTSGSGSEWVAVLVSAHQDACNAFTDAIVKLRKQGKDVVDDPDPSQDKGEAKKRRYRLQPPGNGRVRTMCVAVCRRGSSEWWMASGQV